LSVPLQTDERVIGLLYLDSPYLVREFSAEDLNLVTVMANIAAIRIEHARLVEEEQAKKLLNLELERAAEIQRKLLPSSAPNIPQLDLAGFNAPCRTVGGDYYDFLSYPDGRVGIFIGDVSGKGLAAALLMSSLRACVHVLFEDPNQFPDQVQRLNRSITATCPSNCFITMFMAVLDPYTGRFVYCNAGHNPPLLLHGRDGLQRLAATGIPLGMLRGTHYEQRSGHLEKGDMLVLFSDGVTEACRLGDEEDFGEERLLAVVRSKSDQSAAQIIESINAELCAFTGDCPLADDTTLVVVRR
jgi:sigma-B regulation protein RsbU (phosphoserine phosphatase)